MTVVPVQAADRHAASCRPVERRHRPGVAREIVERLELSGGPEVLDGARQVTELAMREPAVVVGDGQGGVAPDGAIKVLQSASRTAPGGVEPRFSFRAPLPRGSEP